MKKKPSLDGFSLCDETITSAITLLRCDTRGTSLGSKVLSLSRKRLVAQSLKVRRVLTAAGRRRRTVAATTYSIGKARKSSRGPPPRLSSRRRAREKCLASPPRYARCSFLSFTITIEDTPALALTLAHINRGRPAG